MIDIWKAFGYNLMAERLTRASKLLAARVASQSYESQPVAPLKAPEACQHSVAGAICAAPLLGKRNPPQTIVICSNVASRRGV